MFVEAVFFDTVIWSVMSSQSCGRIDLYNFNLKKNPDASNCVVLGVSVLKA